MSHPSIDAYLGRIPRASRPRGSADQHPRIRNLLHPSSSKTTRMTAAAVVFLVTFACLVGIASAQAPDSSTDEADQSDSAPRIWQYSLRFPDSSFVDGHQLIEFGETIEVLLVFDKLIIVTGAPQVSLTIGERTRQATYFSEDDDDARNGMVRFRYTVQATDRDTDGVVASALTLNGGTIKDATDRITNADLSDSALHYPRSRVDGSAVTPPMIYQIDIIDVRATSRSKRVIYGLGDTILADVAFDRRVIVSGVPQLEIVIGERRRMANYGRSFPDNRRLYFCYTVQEEDRDTDGISIAQNALVLNDGAIKRAVDGTIDADLTHAELAPDPDHIVDGRSKSRRSDSVIYHACAP